MTDVIHIRIRPDDYHFITEFRLNNLAIKSHHNLIRAETNERHPRNLLKIIMDIHSIMMYQLAFST